MIGPILILFAVAFAAVKDETKVKKEPQKCDNYFGIARKSSSSQDSLDEQLEWIQKTGKENKLHQAGILSKTCKGFLFVTRYKKKIMKVAKEKGIGYLILHRIDRGGRNAADYMKMLDELNEIRPISLITSEGTFNYDDPNDKFIVRIFLLQAEQELSQKNSRVILKLSHMFKNNIYPRKKAPFGYEKDNNNHLVPKPWCKEVINFIFDTFENVKNYSSTAIIVNKRYLANIGKAIPLYDLRGILQNRIYTGYFSWGGEIFGDGEQGLPHESIKVISEEKFERIQKIIDDINKVYSRSTNDGVQSLIETYSLPDVEDVIKLRPPCPNCGSYISQDNGTSVVDNFIQKKYICTQCDTVFRSPLVREIKKIHDLNSLPCPNCRSKKNFSYSHEGAKIWILKCTKCGFVQYFSEFSDIVTKNKEKKQPRRKRMKNEMTMDQRLDDLIKKPHSN
jgi:DNA invertase Pin-like site-specific DNA recombinase/DNA-directed RNA polymerase subunit RPC12/RpoP